MKEKTMADFLAEKAREIIGDTFCYISKPYSCSFETEGRMHFESYVYPKPEQYTLEKTEDGFHVYLNPMKGNRKRKLYDIHMWKM